MKWLRKLLGIGSLDIRMEAIEKDIARLQELAIMGVDVSFREQSQIIIISKLRDGQIRIIPAKFDNLMELEAYCKDIRTRYGIKNEVWDKPLGMWE